MPGQQPTPPSKNKLSVSLDLRVVIAALLLVILGMIAVWKPWMSGTSEDRTISVTGEATIKAEPDEYVFYPSYQFKNASKDTALADMSKRSDAIVAELKKLGVEDKNIKTNSGGYELGIREPNDDNTTYTLSLTITVGTKDLAQKVQDYLLTTSPTGAVAPQPTFSDAKRKALEGQARDEATKDARAKADQSAQNLGFKVGKVKSVSDGAGFGDSMPLDASVRSGGASAVPEKATQLSIQPGQNELNYSVTVIYFVK